MTLSVLMITKNNEEVIEEALKSVKDLVGEILVDDDGSTDGTAEIVKKYGGKAFNSHGKNLGERKQGLIEKAKGDWILILDADERVSPELKKEIIQTLKSPLKSPKIVGYKIPYQNYVFGKPVYAGGENYSKLRLFRRGKGRVETIPIHEDIKIEGKIGQFNGVIHHHSFRTPVQFFGKFTSYAWVISGEKYRNHEPIAFTKLFLYGPHMFWARYIKEKGYTDGLAGLILAKAFAYMEGLTYWFLLWRKLW